jgi:putative ABC transport system permease protein
MSDKIRPTLSALMGLVALVLAIACVNVANLMVARAERSHRETAISMALGATRLRLWTQNLLESLVVGTVAVTLGLVVAVWMRRLLVQLVPDRQQLDVEMDTRVFGASALLGANVSSFGRGTS